MIDVRDFGAVLDGVTDNRTALSRALASTKSGTTVTIPAGACRIVATSGSSLTLPAGITLAGAGAGRTRLVLDTDESGAYRELLRLAGDGSTVRNLTLTATPQASGVLLRVAASNATVKNATLDGQRTTTAPYLHGLMLPDSGAVKNLRMTAVTVQRLTYGLLQSSASTATVAGVTVDRCSFRDNLADDLEFNAPNGDMSGVTVQRSHFRDTGGFGIGLANVQGAQIVGNYIQGCRQESLHIEDRTSGVQVSGNTFWRNQPNPADWYSFVFVMNASTGVEVVGNTFRATHQPQPFRCVYVGPGGDYPAPSGVRVADNIADLPCACTTLLDVYGGVDVTTT